MKLPLSWVQDYVDLSGVDYKELAQKLVHIGFEVEEIVDTGAGLSGVVAGKIVSAAPHENADKLQVCKIDIGKNRPLQIVTGAKNIATGDTVPVATDGAELPGGVKIVTNSLRGVLSEGMLCSGKELGADESLVKGAGVDGILILPGGIKPGADIKTALGLNEIVLDVGITANRPDCQSVYGMAREIGAMLKRPVKPLNLSYKVKASDQKPPAVEVKDFTRCSRYTGRVIENVKIAESPDYIKRRLRLTGLKPINNVVDITNYVLMEVGQPLHAFDIRRIDRKIVVRCAAEGERIKLLDGQVYALKDTMLVIADASKPLALAGVMGGEHSGIASDTQTVFLEAARFARGSIRSTARALGLKSDSSARYEKGVDYLSIDTGRERALALFDELQAGEVSALASESSAPAPQEKVIETSAAQISGVLGLEVPAKDIGGILSALGIKTTVKKDKLLCKIPLFREDMDGYPDLAEEVIRFYGYDRIRSTMFAPGETAVGGYGERDLRIQAIKSAMIGAGAYEAVTYAFIPQKQCDKLNMPAHDARRDTIKVFNPLSEEYAVMRTQLSGGMLNAVRLNLSRKNDAFRLFEVGRAYRAKSLPLTELPAEDETLCVAFVGAGEDFYTLKSAVTELLAVFKTDYKLEYTDCPWLHPGVGAKIVCGGGGVIGHFGKIHPVVAKNFDIAGDVYLAEITLEGLISRTMPNIRYKALPKFPFVDRDLAVIVQEECLVGALSDCIKETAQGLCERVELFDVYKGAQIEAGHKSIAFSIRLRSPDATLTDAEIQAVMAKTVAALKEKFGAVLRA